MSDMMSAGALLRSLLPELFLSCGAMILLLASVWSPQKDLAGSAEGAERTQTLARFGAVICILVALVVVIAWGDGGGSSPDGRIAGDGFRWGMDLVILLGTVLSLLLLEAEHERSAAFGPEVPALMLLAATGMMVLAAARDLILVFIGLELMSFAVYVLAGVNRRSSRSAESAIKYFLLGAVSSAFLLYGMTFIYGATGSTLFSEVGAWISGRGVLTPLFLMGVGIMLVGLAFKVAAAPFHLWTPDVYDGAPLPITAFMSAAVKTAGFAMFVRVMLDMLGGAMPRWHMAVWWLAAFTMVAGNVLALSQRNLVRILAYSSIAHAGYLLVAVVSGGAAGTSAIVFYLVSYTLATMGAFGVLITINAGRDHSPTLDDIAGLWLVRPWLAMAMSVFLLAFLGIPVLGGMGFFAKWYVLQAALQAPVPQTILVVVLVLMSAVSSAYYLSIVSAMFMRPRPEAQPVPSTTPSNRTLIVAAAVALLVLGLYPSPAMRVARLAITSVGQQPVTPPADGARIQTASTQP